VRMIDYGPALEPRTRTRDRWRYRMAVLVLILARPLATLNRVVFARWRVTRVLWWRIGYHGPYQLCWWAFRQTGRRNIFE
jgi:hypothetical protein